jgi:hypothetical protein
MFDRSLLSLQLAPVGHCLPHSLADNKHVCSLIRPGQRRAGRVSAAARDFPTLAAGRPLGSVGADA